MEFTFTPKRVAALLACLVLFAWLGGFTPPYHQENLQMEMLSRKATRAWLTCVLLFITGAAMTTVVDHWVGMMPPSNWRPLYVLGGIALMSFAAFWYRAMLAAWAMQSAA